MVSSPERGGPVAKTTSGKRSAHVAAALRKAIADRHYLIGSPLPTEMELCRRFAVSRHTVREALRELHELGLIQRRQGSGTRVIAMVTPTTYVQSMHSLQELAQYAYDTTLQVDQMRPISLTKAAAALVPGEIGSTWLVIKGVRLSGVQGALICATTVYVSMRFAPILHEYSDFRGPIYALVEARTGERVAEVTQDVSALLVPSAIAKRLQVPLGSAVLRLIRRYFNGEGSLILTSVNWHPADRFTYSMHLKLNERLEQSRPVRQKQR